MLSQVRNIQSGMLSPVGMKIVPFTGVPKITDYLYAVGTVGLDNDTKDFYILRDNTKNAADWQKLTSASIDFYENVLSIADASIAPPTEVIADRYILDASIPVHASWDGAVSQDIVEFNGSTWISTTPSSGGFIYVDDITILYVFTGAAWQPITAAVPDATTSVKGIASFETLDFNISSGAVELKDTVIKTITTDSGAMTPSAHSVSFIGGEGIDVTHVDAVATIVGEDASETNKGIASFEEYDFNVAAGHVSLTNGSGILFVGKWGNDLADGLNFESAKLTVQAAVTAAAVGDTIFVYPGTYTETITHVANNVTMIAMGKPNTVVLTQADANVVDFSTYTGIQYKFFGITCTAATTAINTVQGTTGSCTFKECRLGMTSTAAIVAASQPAVGAITGAGQLIMRIGQVTYAHTGACGGTAQKGAFKVGDGSVIEIGLIKNLDVSNSGTALVSSVCLDTSSTGYFDVYENAISVTDPNATIVAGLGYLGGTGIDHEFRRNNIHINVQANAGYGIFAADTASTTRSFYNHIHVVDTGGTSYGFYVAASATLTSQFDDIIADDGNNITGTFVQVNSPVDGNLDVSGWLNITEDTYPNNISGIKFGSGDETSIREYWDDQLYFKIDGNDSFSLSNNYFRGVGGGGSISDQDNDSTAGLGFANDSNSGFGYQGADRFAILAGGKQAGQVEEVSNIAWATFFNHLDFKGISAGYADSQNVMMQAGVQTTDATVTEIATITLPDNTMVTVEARFNGFISDYSASCGGFLRYTARRVAGGAIEVAAPIVDIQEDSAGSPVVDADVSGNTVRLLVTGVAAETWNWTVTYNYNFTKTSA